jgi:hypothetical protein
LQHPPVEIMFRPIGIGRNGSFKYSIRGQFSELPNTTALYMKLSDQRNIRLQRRPMKTEQRLYVLAYENGTLGNRRIRPANPGVARCIHYSVRHCLRLRTSRYYNG